MPKTWQVFREIGGHGPQQLVRTFYNPDNAQDYLWDMETGYPKDRFFIAEGFDYPEPIERTARKEWTCWHCSVPIHAGERYLDYHSNLRSCLSCSAL